MIFWGECLEACAGQHGNPRRSNETVWAAPSFMMTRSTDSFASWTQENLTAINDPETFPENTYGYGLEDPTSGDLLFCGPYTMTGKAGCMVSEDGGHHFKPLAQTQPPPALMKHGWSEQQMARLSGLGAQVGCAFLERTLHSRMPFVPTHARLKLLHACDQYHSLKRACMHVANTIP
jgi:hypothetical protein